MAIGIFLDRMCLALLASGLWLCYARGLPSMTSALEGGRGGSRKVDKSTDKFCDHVCDKGGGVQKSPLWYIFLLWPRKKNLDFPQGSTVYVADLPKN